MLIYKGSGSLIMARFVLLSRETSMNWHYITTKSNLATNKADPLIYEYQKEIQLVSISMQFFSFN